MKRQLQSTLLLSSNFLFTQNAIGQQLSIKEEGTKTKEVPFFKTSIRT